MDFTLDDPFSLIIDHNGQRSTLSLDTPYKQCTDPEKKDIVAQIYVRQVLKTMSQTTRIPQRFELAHRHLLPRVFPSYELAAWYRLLYGAEQDEDEWFQPCGEHLAIGLVYLLPNRFVAVTKKMLTDWRLTGEYAFKIACMNLRNRSPRPFQSPAPGVFVWHDDDEYEASRLVLMEVFRDLKVKGDYVAIAPYQDTLVVTGTEDRNGLENVLQLRGFLPPDGLIRILPIRLRNRQWESYEPDLWHPGLHEFHALRNQFLHDIYAEQRIALQTCFHDKGENVLVASYLLMWDGDDETRTPSYSCWTESAPSLLPRTDKVAFGRRNGKGGFALAAFADWDRVQEVVGHLMTPLGIYPERFRVDHFPSNDQLKALGFFSGLAYPDPAPDEEWFEIL